MQSGTDESQAFQTLPREPLRNPSSWRNFLWPVSMVLLFVAWRFMVFAMVHPNFLHDGNNYEELYRGTIAHELMLGTELPIWDYRADDYAGGFYPVVTILPLFFYVLGSSVLALKTFAISHTALALLAWFLVLQRFVSRRAAVLFALLYTATPFAYIKISSTVLGDHAETCVLSALSVLVFFRMLSFEGRAKKLAAFTLGLLSGFGLWFAYIYGFTLAAILLYLSLHRINFFRSKSCLLLIAGFAVGFTPWLVFNYMKNFSGLIVYGVPVWKLFDFQIVRSPNELFFFRLLSSENVVPREMGFHAVLSAIYWVILGVSLLAGGILALRLKKARWIEVFQGPKGLCALYLLIYFTVQHLVTPVGFRFLIPVFPFAIALFAILAAYLMKKHQSVFGPVLGVLLVLGLSTSAINFYPKLAGSYLSYKGYALKILGYEPEVLPRIEEGLAGNFSGLRPSDKTGYVIALARQITLIEEPHAQDILDRIQLVPKKFRPFFAFVVGRELLWHYLDPVKAVQFIEPLRVSHPDIFEQSARGIFSAFSLIDDPHMNVPEIQKKLSADLAYRTASYEGFQFTFKKLQEDADLRKFSDSLLNEIKDFDEERKQRFVRGVGRQLFRQWASSDPHHPFFHPQELEIYFTTVQDPLFEGVASQMLRKHLFLYGSPIVWNWNEFFLGLDESGRKKLVAGLKFIIDRWGLPEDGIPFDKLKSIEEFW